MVKQIPFILISVILGIVMLSAGVQFWWAWGIWAVVLCAQIGVGLGWHEPDDHRGREWAQAELARLEQEDEWARMDAEHQARVDAWVRDQQK